MSLAEAVAEIADQLEKDAAEIKSEMPTIAVALRAYAQQLRIAIKASQGETQRVTRRDVGELPPEILLPLQQQAARGKREADMLTNVQSRMVMCVGGCSDGIVAPISSEAPIGCFAEVGGEAYQLVQENNSLRLRFSAKETQKMREGQ